jgi:phosphatidate cytidylyltransferase
LITRIATAVVLIPIVLLLVLSAPVPLLAVVAAIVALITTHEFLKIASAFGVQPFPKATYILITLFFLLLAIDAGTPLLATGFWLYLVAVTASLFPFVFLTLGMRREYLDIAYPAAAASVFAFTYIALPLGFLVQLRQHWAGAILVIYLLLVVWTGDIFAYFVGRFLGRHWMAPRISPRKTWEGAIASLVASVAAGTIFCKYALPISSALLQAHLIQRHDGMFGLQAPPLLPIVLLSAVINVAAQIGDLVESLLKRGAGVKDSGGILPGHGGMLDRIDALLFAAPVLWYYAAWRMLQ